MGKSKQSYALIKFFQHSTHAHRHTKAIIRSTGMLSTKIYSTLQKSSIFLKFGNLEFAAVTDDDRGFWLSRFWSRVFNFLNKIHAACDLTEHYVAAIKPRADHGGDEELNEMKIAQKDEICKINWEIKMEVGIKVKKRFTKWKNI
jgi:hypothetical protein